MIKELETQHTGVQEIELLQQNTKNFVKSLERNPLLDGILIKNVFFSGAVTVNIAHKLGRKPRGWFTTDITGNLANIARNVGDCNDKFLSLAASATCTISLWVF